MKNNKQNQGPEFYKGLDLENNKNLKLCLVWNKGDNKIFKFDSPSHISLVKDAILRKFDNWDDLETNKDWQMPQLEEEHKRLFGHPIPAKATRVEACVAIWQKWCSIAEDRTKTGNPVNASGNKKQSYDNRIYTLLTGSKDMGLKTPQAIACVKILEESMAKSEVPGELGTITEKDLKAKIYERGAELRTRQDAWRIFQYYRPQLIQTKVLKHN